MIARRGSSRVQQASTLADANTRSQYPGRIRQPGSRSMVPKGVCAARLPRAVHLHAAVSGTSSYVGPAECQGHSVDSAYRFTSSLPCTSFASFTSLSGFGAALRRATRRWRSIGQRTILDAMRCSALLCRIVGTLAMAAVLLSLPLHAGIAMRSEEHTSELQSLMR